MKKEKVYRVSDAQKEVQEVLGTHDFRKLLKELRIIGTFTFPTIQTNHNDVVQPGQYHELCRYSIQPKNNDDTNIKEFEETLKNYWRMVRRATLIRNYIHGKILNAIFV